MLLALAALLLAAPLALAEPTGESTRFRQSWQVRGALGDIPTTDALESTGFWNVEELARVAFAPNVSQDVSFQLPEGAVFVAAGCSCGAPQVAWNGSTATLTVASGSAGDHVVTFQHRRPMTAGETFAFRVPDPGDARRADALLLFYLPDTYNLVGPVEADFALPSTSENPGLMIHGFSGDAARPLPATLDFAAHLDTSSGFARDPAATGAPAAPAAAPAPAEAPSSGLTRALLLIAAGLVFGGGVGWLATERLMRRKAPAPRLDTREVLEARRRALVAGLAELDAARGPDAGADAAIEKVRAEFKEDVLHTMKELAELERR